MSTTDLTPEYVVLSESETIHLVVIRYGDGLPWLRVVAVFPSKERAEEYADFENTFVDDEEAPPFADELKYDHPDAAEPASALPRFLPARQAPQIEPAPEMPAALTVAATEPVAAETAEPEPGAKAEEPEPATPTQPTEPAAEVQPKPKYVPHHKGGSHASNANPEVDAIVRKLYPDRSISTREIGRRAGIDQASVSQVAKRFGLAPRGRPGAKPAMAPVAVAPQAQSEPEIATPELPPQPRDIPQAAAIDRDAIKITTIPGQSKIECGGRSSPLTEGQARLLSILLPASPAPVGDAHVIKMLFGSSIRRDDAEVRLRSMVTTLQERVLPGVGLELKSMKGIGLALQQAEEVAA